MATPQAIADRREVDRLRGELKSRETPELIYDLGENARDEGLSMVTNREKRAMSNGNGSAGAAGMMQMPTQQQIAEANALVAKISPNIKVVLTTTVRGLLTGFPGIPPHVLLSIIAAETGTIVGGALQGDLGPMMQLRNTFRDAFNEGMRKAPLNAIPAQGVPADIRGEG